MIGRIQVIKSFAIPKILYRVTLVHAKNQILPKKSMSCFILSYGKVKRAAFINCIDEGGLIVSMISTQK